MSKAKYKKGRQITSVADFEQCQSMWFKWRNATRHRSILESLQYHTLKNHIAYGFIFVADKIGENE